MTCIHRKESFKIDSNVTPDIKVYGMGGVSRCAHRIMISRLSSFLASVLKVNETEEDLAIILPDVPGQVIDLMIELAYNGWVGGLGIANISQVRDVCKILDMTQRDFVVRSEDKYINRTGDSTSVARTAEPNQFGEVTNSVVTKVAENYDETDSCPPVQENLETRIKTQGSFQCQQCDKTFIYAKSFERHGEICNSNFQQPSLGSSGGNSGVEYNTRGGSAKKRTTRKRRREKFSDPPDGSDVDDPKPTVKFKFQHYEEVNGEFFCRFPECSYTDSFKTVENCKNHQLLLHATSQEKVFVCDVCQEKFASNRLKNKHMNVNHNKRFECDVCRKRFCEKTRLIIHKRIHTGEKPFVCDTCGYSCTQRNNLRKHKELRHSNSDTKKHVCEVCSARFNTKGNLKRHKQIHNAVKDLPFVCETCGKNFKDKGALNQHSYSHGSTKYNCKECGSSFSSPLYLYRHTVRKHPTNGVQPFKCDRCSKGFPQKHQLQIHIQAVHENLKHSCPNCNQLMGRKTSLYRHLKTGRCPGMSHQSSMDSGGLESVLQQLQQQPELLRPPMQQSSLQQPTDFLKQTYPIDNFRPSIGHPDYLKASDIEQDLKMNSQHAEELKSAVTGQLDLHQQLGQLKSTQNADIGRTIHHQDLIKSSVQQAADSQHILKPDGQGCESHLDPDRHPHAFEVTEGASMGSTDMFGGLTDVSGLTEFSGSIRDLVPTYQVLVSSQPFLMYPKSGPDSQ